MSWYKKIQETVIFGKTQDVDLGYIKILFVLRWGFGVIITAAFHQFKPAFIANFAVTSGNIYHMGLTAAFLTFHHDDTPLQNQSRSIVYNAG